jgi:hypothetical protein
VGIGPLVKVGIGPLVKVGIGPLVTAPAGSAKTNIQQIVAQMRTKLRTLVIQHHLQSIAQYFFGAKY